MAIYVTVTFILSVFCRLFLSFSAASVLMAGSVHSLSARLALEARARQVYGAGSLFVCLLSLSMCVSFCRWTRCCFCFKYRMFRAFAPKIYGVGVFQPDLSDYKGLCRWPGDFLLKKLSEQMHHTGVVVWSQHAQALYSGKSSRHCRRRSFSFADRTKYHQPAWTYLD